MVVTEVAVSVSKGGSPAAALAAACILRARNFWASSSEGVSLMFWVAGKCELCCTTGMGAGCDAGAPIRLAIALKSFPLGLPFVGEADTGFKTGGSTGAGVGAIGPLVLEDAPTFIAMAAKSFPLGLPADGDPDAGCCSTSWVPLACSLACVAMSEAADFPGREAGFACCIAGSVGSVGCGLAGGC
jgi:hypothetical protein